MTETDKKAKPRHLVTGERGEEAAARYMLEHGYQIIARNVRESHCEIDIVARDEDEIVFTEVRTRNAGIIAAPEDTIGPRKLRLLIKAAAMWADEHNYTGPYRIDAAGVTAEDGEPVKIEYIKSITEPII
ncbi:MAG: YraN family protein [Cloacibacillus sp.]